MNGNDERVETVSELNGRIKMVLESEFRGVWVRGEISNLRRQTSGHCYFSLKDAGSQISAVLFRGNATRQSIDLRDGLQVLAYGEVSLYEPRGTYQLIVRVIMDDGAGKLQQEFERLKRMLSEEGLFDAERKKSLPVLPATVGFITSPTGAAVQDFLRILKRRRWKGRVVVLPARVQGAGAALEMVGMLQTAQRLGFFDLLVIGRGGGSLEDLWAFNEEPLVRAVAACSIPIISAVGHEIDFALTDFAADVRAETPSAAAELISSAYVRCDERFGLARQALDALVGRYLAERRRVVEGCANHLRLLSPRQRIEQHYLRLDDLSNRLRHGLGRVVDRHGRSLGRLRERLQAHAPAARVRLARQELRALGERLRRASLQDVEGRRLHLRQLEKRLASASPQSVLNRGFVMMRQRGGEPVGRKALVEAGAELTATFADGDLPVRVESTGDS
jgi:exodeoxyribonuclease VII large subunit